MDRAESNGFAGRGVVDAQRLTTAAAAGDKGALTELLCQYDPLLRERLRGRVGRRFRLSFEEDDVYQVTYLEAFLRIGTFRPVSDGSFLAWLLRIAENNIRDAVKALERDRRPPPNRRVSNIIGDESYECLFATLAGSQTTPSQGASRNEAKALLEAALAQLPPDYQKVVRLCDLQGMSGPEAAKEIGRSAGAVHMLKARAHERLAEILGESGKFFSRGA
jgi:RNA polymerase sigma-70 factor (ECF subfamily)